VVFRDTGYARVKGALPVLCERCFGPVIGWLAEGEREGIVNYACLFKAEDELLLFDLLVVAEDVFASNPTAQADRIIFDRDDYLKGSTPVSKSLSHDSSQAKLAECLQDYWTYMYLNGKYCRRRDLFKLLSTQEALFQRHVNALRFLYAGREWTGWAAKDVRQFPRDCQDRLLMYFAGARLETIGEILKQEMDNFSNEAREACKRHRVEYPDELEFSVREHLRRTRTVPEEPLVNQAS
jgi:hypothetical protein